MCKLINMNKDWQIHTLELPAAEINLLPFACISDDAWLRGEDGFCSYGTAWQAPIQSSDRFDTAQLAFSQWVQTVSPLIPPEKINNLVAIAAFPFSANSKKSAVLRVPQFLIAKANGRAWCTWVGNREKTLSTQIINTTADQALRDFKELDWIAKHELLNAYTHDIGYEHSCLAYCNHEICDCKADYELCLANFDFTKLESPSNTHLSVEFADAQWEQTISKAIKILNTDPTLKKLVLSRQVKVTSNKPFDPALIFYRLAKKFPDCWTYRYFLDNKIFIGATPEMLISKTNTDFHCHVLAGTASSKNGKEALHCSTKDKIEHTYAVDSVVSALEPYATALHYSPEPGVQEIANVAHLYTDVCGTSQASLLQLAQALHPTAAVGGTPRLPALTIIEQLEPADREYYAGAIGWVNATQSGQLAIALRCAQFDPYHPDLPLTAYAGGGIVAQSEAITEVEETRLKLQAILGVL